MGTERFRDWEDEGGTGPDDPEEDGLFSAEEADLSPLSNMSGRALRRIIDRSDPETLSLALCTADPAVADRVLQNVSVHAAEFLRAEIQRNAGMPREVYRDAQRTLMATAYSLEERGEISLDGPADDTIPPLEIETEGKLSAHHLAEMEAAEAIDLLALFSARALRHGLLSLEPALDRMPGSVLSTGLRMVIDLSLVEDIESIVGRQIDAYIVHLERNGEILIEGLASIVSEEGRERARARLVAFLPEGAADYERLPEMHLPPSAQATSRIISLCCDLAEEAHREGLAALEGRLGDIPEALLRRGLRWALEGAGIDEIERMLERRHRTRTEKERRKLELILEGLLLIREGVPPDRLREALEGFLEEKA
ncbi:MAG: hypothetical protein O2807_00245 [bacterium]|nr:hypothetical protein [bacterium]